jgi:glycosyltransferase involved in cell wall biosynthesis
MKSQPLVSVIMITYNHAQFIEEAINGVLMQDCEFSFELIVANDHSSDSSDSVIKKVLEKHPKSNCVKYIYCDVNLGMIANFIFAFKQASGKYLAICEGDDYWTDSKKLQTQVNFLEKNPEFSMTCHDAMVINEENQTSKPFFTHYHQKEICNTRDTLNIHFCPTASVLFRKDALMTSIETEIVELAPMAGDHLLVQLLSLRGLIHRTHEVMCVYRNHVNGVSHKNEQFLAEGLKNRINTLVFLNKVSKKKFQKNIKIEIRLLKNRIRLLKNRSRITKLYLRSSRKGLTFLKRFI